MSFSSFIASLTRRDFLRRISALIMATATGAWPVELPRQPGGPRQKPPGAVGDVPIVDVPVAGEAEADFVARRTSPGVVRSFKFDEVTTLGPNAISNPNASYLDNVGITVGPSPIVIDNVVKPSGTGSMRHDRPSYSASDATGAWFANFSPDYSLRPGPGDSIYIQMRIRWNLAMTLITFWNYYFDINPVINLPVTYIDATHCKTTRPLLSPAETGNIISGVFGQYRANGATTYFSISNVSTDPVTQISTITCVGGDFGNFDPAMTSISTITPFASTTNLGNAATLINLDSTHFAVQGQVPQWLSQYGVIYPNMFVETKNPSNPINSPGYQRVLSFTYDSVNNRTVFTLDATKPVYGPLDGAATEVYVGGSVQAGIKFFDVAAGDILGGWHPYTDGITHYYSSAILKLVIQTYYQQHFLHTYTYMDSQDGHPWNVTDTPLFAQGPPIPSGDLDMEPGSQCMYQASLTTGINAAPPACWIMPADEWITFQLGMYFGDSFQTIGTFPQADPEFGGDYRVFHNSRVKIWTARDGGTSQLIVDWNPGTPGYRPLIAYNTNQDMRYGKVWLFPYLTAKSLTQRHGLGQVWYDEVIIKHTTNDAGLTQPVPDPQVSQKNPKFTNMAANSAIDLGQYTCTTRAGYEAFSVQVQIQYFCGFNYDPKRRQIPFFGGGHSGTNYNAVNCFKMDSATWVEEYPPQNYDELVRTNYNQTIAGWLSGRDGGPYPRPAARHGEGHDGIIVDDELILLGGVEGEGPGIPEDPNNPNIDYYKVIGKTWHYSFNTKTWSNGPDALNVIQPAACYDPLSGLIWVMGDHYMKTYDPKARVWTDWLDFTSFAGLANIVDENGNQFLSQTTGGCPLSINSCMVFCPANGYIYYMDAGSSSTYPPSEVYELRPSRASPKDSMIVHINATGVKPAATGLGSGPRYNWDTVNGLLVTGPMGDPSNPTYGDRFYGYNPITKAWSHQVISGGVAPGLLAHQCSAYDTLNNVHVTLLDVSNGGAHVWAYRWR